MPPSALRSRNLAIGEVSPSGWMNSILVLGSVTNTVITPCSGNGTAAAIPVSTRRVGARGYAFAEHAPNLHHQNVNVTQRLLAPLLIDRGTHRPAHRLRHGVGHDVVDDFSGGILLGYSDQINLGVVGQFALFGHRNRHESAAGESHAAALDHGTRF